MTTFVVESGGRVPRIPRVRGLVAVAPGLRKADSPTRKEKFMRTAAVSSMLILLSISSPALASFPCSTQGVYPEICLADMPVLDQKNPNFATVSVPDDIYCSERNPKHSIGLPGQLCRVGVPTGGFCSGGVGCLPLVPASYTDNYGYNTWLPLGAFAGDPEYVWDTTSDKFVPGTSDHDATTNFCGVVAMVMVLDTALEYASHTTIAPNSWLAHYYQPDSSGNVADANLTPTSKRLPSPLFNAYRRESAGLDLRDCSANDPGACMTQAQLQQVINFNILRSVDPTDSQGSNDGEGFPGLIKDGNFAYNKSGVAASAVSDHDVSFSTFTALVRGGAAVYMRHSEYYAKAVSVVCPSGIGECLDITLTKTDPAGNLVHSGHYEALRGYSLDASGNYQFYFNNPGTGAFEVLDNGPTGLEEVKVGQYYECPGGVIPYAARVVNGTDSALPYSTQDKIIFWPDDKANANRLCDIVDGDSVYVTTDYKGLSLP
jgi:hypothetical protein